MKNPMIKITVRDFGEMTAELYPDKAPTTVQNFLSLIESGFYSGVIFHRVIKGFMIQGGGFDESFQQKPADAIRGEFIANGFMQNDLKHTRGVLSMARTSDPNSASSQFFVMHKDAPYLDAQYAGFGKLTDGFDVLDAIAGVKTGQITYAIKNTSIDGREIHEGDYMGLFNKDIVLTSRDKVDAACRLLDEMIDEDSEIITLIRGEDATDEELEKVSAYISEHFDTDLEVQNGGQPVYSFIIGVE